MKSFLKNCLLFGSPLLALFVITAFLADGSTDPYYLRLTSPRQHSLIIGTSRAAHGLHPDILNQELKNEYKNSNLYNFSFTEDDSPFGKVYFEAICKKLDRSSKEGLFIITVDPWAISCNTSEQENAGVFRENPRYLSKVNSVNQYPNVPYLFNCYNEPYLSILYKRIKKDVFNKKPPFYLHTNGWLEVTLPMDSISKRLYTKKERYEKYLQYQYRPSKVRKWYLAKTITFLKEYGHVFLVRLPIHSALLMPENAMYPDFDSCMDSLSKKYDIPYFNLTATWRDYQYTDGSHVSKESGVLLSDRLAGLIVKYKMVTPVR